MKMPDGYKLVVKESKPGYSFPYESTLYSSSGVKIDRFFTATVWGAKFKAKGIARKDARQRAEGKFEATYHMKDGKWQRTNTKSRLEGVSR